MLPHKRCQCRQCRRRPRGRVVEQLDDADADVQAVSPNSHDDECRTRSTSRIPRASGEEDLPSGLLISRAAEAGEVDPKFLQHRGVLEVDSSPNHGPLHGATEVRRSETILLERGSQHRISVRLKAKSTPSVLQQETSQEEENREKREAPKGQVCSLFCLGSSLYRLMGCLNPLGLAMWD